MWMSVTKLSSYLFCHCIILYINAGRCSVSTSMFFTWHVHFIICLKYAFTIIPPVNYATCKLLSQFWTYVISCMYYTSVLYTIHVQFITWRDYAFMYTSSCLPTKSYCAHELSVLNLNYWSTSLCSSHLCKLKLPLYFCIKVHVYWNYH